MVVVEGVARSSIELRHMKVADPWCANGSSANLDPWAAFRRDVRRGRVGSSAVRCRDRGARVWAGQFETMTRERLTLSPETIAAMGRTARPEERWRPCAVDHADLIGILLAVRHLNDCTEPTDCYQR